MSEEKQEQVKEEKMEQENTESTGSKPEGLNEEKKSDEGSADDLAEAAGETAAVEQGREEGKAEASGAQSVSDDDQGSELSDKKQEEADKEGSVEEKKEDEQDGRKEEGGVPAAGEQKKDAIIFALRTTANREDQVMDFVTSNITRKGLEVFSVIRAHGMRGYIFIEAGSRADAEQASYGIPYARGILPKEIDYSEMEHMIEPMKREINIMKNDIVEIISGPFKRETAKITRIDEQKDEVVVELVEAAVPIPITLKIDAVKVIRRDSEETKV